jgi:hypothetical protein
MRLTFEELSISGAIPGSSNTALQIEADLLEVERDTSVKIIPRASRPACNPTFFQPGQRYRALPVIYNPQRMCLEKFHWRRIQACSPLWCGSTIRPTGADGGGRRYRAISEISTYPEARSGSRQANTSGGPHGGLHRVVYGRERFPK